MQSRFWNLFEFDSHASDGPLEAVAFRRTRKSRKIPPLRLSDNKQKNHKKNRPPHHRPKLKNSKNFSRNKSKSAIAVRTSRASNAVPREYFKTFRRRFRFQLQRVHVLHGLKRTRRLNLTRKLAFCYCSDRWEEFETRASGDF